MVVVGKLVIKGCLPKWTARSWARSGNSGQAGCLGATKLRRRLARGYELLRWCNKPREHKAQQFCAAVPLCQRLQLGENPQEVTVKASLQARLPVWREELRGLEKANKNSALKVWKRRILNEPAGMGAWLRHRERVPVTSVIRNG